MRKTSLLLIGLLLLTFIGSAQPVENSSLDANPGLTPANVFYPAEVFVENLEVKIAGIIGGPDMKSKALANNAEERIAEANKLIDMGKSEKAADVIQKYSNTIKQSRELAARDQELQQKLENISNKNTEKLRNVKKRVPSQAKETIERAIKKSQKPSKPGNKTNKSKSLRKPEADKYLPNENISNNTGVKNSSNPKVTNKSTLKNGSSEATKQNNNAERDVDSQNIQPDMGSSEESSNTGKIIENKSITGLR